MRANFDDICVTAVVLVGQPASPTQAHPTSAADGTTPDTGAASIRSVLQQDHPDLDLIVVDGRGQHAPPDFIPEDADGTRIHHLPGSFATRSAMLNAALHAARADFLLLLDHARGNIELRRSALRTMLMAATRRPDVHGVRPALVYGDYERVEPDGTRHEVHLLDWHPGRLRDTFDLGPLLLLDASLLRRCGGFDESLDAVLWYDIRLKLTEHAPAMHIANRYAGSLCAVNAPGDKHNVFDYLLAERDVQQQAERACTAHLKRIGAYLAPGDHILTVDYTPDECARFHDCIASVVTPVNHRPEFIGRAIESVQAQTDPRVEMIVVVNGGPHDPTADQVRRYMDGGDRYDPARPPVRLIVVDINNLGLCLNAGIAAARGKFYVQLDSDDRLKPNAVEKLLEVFDADPTVGMVIGSYEVWTLDENTGQLHRNEEIPVVTHDEWTPENGRNNLLRINGAGAPRAAHIKVIREVGWFGVNDAPACRNYGEDYDLVLRISERYTIGRVWEPIYEVIRHSGGTDHAIDQATIDRNDDAKDHMRIEALRRRRRLNRSPSRGLT